MANDQSIETLKGIGEKTAKLFEKVGIRTIDDLLHYYPRGYDTYGEPKAIGELSEDETGTVEGFLKSGATGVHVNGLSIVQATISDMTGKLRLVWYHMPYLKNALRPDSHFIFRGRVIRKTDSRWNSPRCLSRRPTRNFYPACARSMPRRRVWEIR